MSNHAETLYRLRESWLALGQVRILAAEGEYLMPETDRKEFLAVLEAAEKAMKKCEHMTMQELYDQYGVIGEAIKGRFLMQAATLRKLREGAGISLRRAAKALGITAAYLSDLERGKRALSDLMIDRYHKAVKELSHE